LTLSARTAERAPLRAAEAAVTLTLWTESLVTRVETMAVATGCLDPLFSVSKARFAVGWGAGQEEATVPAATARKPEAEALTATGAGEAFGLAARTRRPRAEAWEGAAVVVVAVAAVRAAFNPEAGAGQREGAGTRTVTETSVFGCRSVLSPASLLPVWARREEGAEAGMREPEGEAEGADPRRIPIPCCLMAAATTTLTCAPLRRAPRPAVVEAGAGTGVSRPSRSERATREARGAWASLGTASTRRATR